MRPVLPRCQSRTNLPQENYRPTSIINIEGKTLNKILNKSNTTLKGSRGIYPKNVRIVQHTKIICHITRMKGKKTWSSELTQKIHVTDFNTQSWWQGAGGNIQQTKNREKVLKMNIGVYKKPTASIMLNGEKLEAFSPNSGTRQRQQLSLCSSTLYWKS